jgi:predicted Zn finger-like uncharacterized protein
MTQLATRCAHCGTSFRVTEAQLAISDGYVRCGRCDAVFNAREALFDLDGGSLSAPMPLAPLAEEPQPAPAQDASAGDDESTLDDGFATTVANEDDAYRAEPYWDDQAPALEAQADPHREPAAAFREAAVVASASDAAPPDPSTDAVDPNQALRHLLGVQALDTQTAAATTAGTQWASLASLAPAAGATRSRWAALLGVVAALLAFALPLQWAWIEREQFRARSPQFDGWLRVHAPWLKSEGLRQLDMVSVAASSLLATPQGNAYQLDLTLQNRGAVPLAAPWVDLRISDSQGRPLVRKALEPQLAVGAAPLRPQEQRAVQIVFRLKTPGAGVSGYEVGLFHP